MNAAIEFPAADDQVQGNADIGGKDDCHEPGEGAARGTLFLQDPYCQQQCQQKPDDRQKVVDNQLQDIDDNRLIPLALKERTWATPAPYNIQPHRGSEHSEATQPDILF